MRVTGWAAAATRCHTPSTSSMLLEAADSAEARLSRLRRRRPGAVDQRDFELRPRAPGSRRARARGRQSSRPRSRRRSARNCSQPACDHPAGGVRVDTLASSAPTTHSLCTLAEPHPARPSCPSLDLPPLPPRKPQPALRRCRRSWQTSPRAAGGQPLSRRPRQRGLAARVTAARCWARPWWRRTCTVDRGAARAFAAWLLPARRRPGAAHHLRGGAHPRRRQLHHAPRQGDPARPRRSSP